MIIKSKREFARVHDEGKSFVNGFIVMHIATGEGKVAFAAGKKLGSAPVRNRVKRLLREAYRLNRHRLSGDVNILLVGRKNACRQKMPTIEKAFLDLAARAGILTD